jgi:hypothetical protein
MDQFIYARNLRELVVYQRAFNVSHGIFDLSKGFPEEEKNALTSQIRQAHESPRVILRSMMKTTKIPYSPITDYRLLITDHFPFASTASAVLLPLDVPLLLSNHIPERGGCVLSISRVSPGCIPSLGFRLGA